MSRPDGTIAELALDARERIFVAEMEDNGIPCVDVRAYYQSAGEWKASRRGLRIRREAFSEFAAMIMAAADAVTVETEVT